MSPNVKMAAQFNARNVVMMKVPRSHNGAFEARAKGAFGATATK